MEAVSVRRRVLVVYERPAPALAYASALFQVRIAASDNASGVAAMQITPDTEAPAEWRAFAETTGFDTAARYIYVRVRDGAGNASEWRRIAADDGAPASRTLRTTQPDEHAKRSYQIRARCHAVANP